MVELVPVAGEADEGVVEGQLLSVSCFAHEDRHLLSTLEEVHDRLVCGEGGLASFRIAGDQLGLNDRRVINANIDTAWNVDAQRQLDDAA